MENINSTHFIVSVVIPFYNAREYVIQAVESALMQPETGEILLIDDNSPDGGLEVCNYLAIKYPIVKLLRHPDHKNHGAASSRNLGIYNSRFPYIAFLDADDYFLPNRFSKTVKVFAENQNVDGVYEAIGAKFQDNDAKKLWEKVSLNEYTTITKTVRPEELFVKMLFDNIGSFSFDGFTARKELFFKVGTFDENLKFFEDTALTIKFAAKGNLYPGSIDKPIAVRRVHQNNRITYHLEDKVKSYESHIALWQSLYDWGKKSLTYDKQILIVIRFIDRIRKADYFENHRFINFLTSRKNMFKLAAHYPKIFLDWRFCKRTIPSKILFTRTFPRG